MLCTGVTTPCNINYIKLLTTTTIATSTIAPNDVWQSITYFVLEVIELLESIVMCRGEIALLHSIVIMYGRDLVDTQHCCVYYGYFVYRRTATELLPCVQAEDCYRAAALCARGGLLQSCWLVCRGRTATELLSCVQGEDCYRAAVLCAGERLLQS